MKFELKFDGVSINADVLKGGAFEKLLKQEMLNTRARLIADTQQGHRADGGSLKPYSMMYRRMIDSGFVQGKSPGNHTVNLTATGVLLRSLQIRLIQNGAQMYFEGTHPPPRPVSEKGAKQKRDKAKNSRNALLLYRERSSTKAVKPDKATLKKTPKSTLRESGKRASSKPKTSGGGDLANAAIAQSQYDMGRTGWMSFSESKDIPRIKAAVLKFLDDMKKKLVERKR